VGFGALWLGWRLGVWSVRVRVRVRAGWDGMGRVRRWVGGMLEVC